MHDHDDPIPPAVFPLGTSDALDAEGDPCEICLGPTPTGSVARYCSACRARDDVFHDIHPRDPYL